MIQAKTAGPADISIRSSIKRLFPGREEGGSLVEMALVSALVYLPLIFGIFEFSYGLYAYTYVSQVARQASRYASVRGVESCSIASAFPDCNLGPSGGTNPTTTSGSTSLQTYVKNKAFAGLSTSNLTVTAKWWQAAVGPGTGAFSTTTWGTQCTTTDANGNACNTPGDAVSVTVTYAFPLNIPFWKNSTLNLSSTSQMIINE